MSSVHSEDIDVDSYLIDVQIDHNNQGVVYNTQVVINGNVEINNYYDTSRVLKDENNDLMPPIEKKIGFLRTETLLREGAKSTAPVADQEIISRDTVGSIVDRNGNWLKVEIEQKDVYFEGWVEESKVERFKIPESKK